MFVVKRDGSLQELDTSMIQNRINYLKNMEPVLHGVNHSTFSLAVIHSLYDTVNMDSNRAVKTSDIDEAASGLAAVTLDHIDYMTLAARIAIDNHHKLTDHPFSEKMRCLWNRTAEVADATVHAPILSEEFFTYVMDNREELDKIVDYSRDFKINYFGFKTLEKSYLYRLNDVIVESPQDMFLRVAVAIHYPDMDAIKSTYDSMSKLKYTHATPTLFNAGSVLGNLSSCFLLGTEDSLEGIMKTASDCARISKTGGGIGVHGYCIRGTGAPIKGTNGYSDGVVNFFRIYDATAVAFNQGGGKRKGAFAIYFSMTHPDVIKFVQMAKTNGDELLLCRNLKLALWVPDLFMKRVEEDGYWCTFCPMRYPRLDNTWGEEFEKIYLQLEADGLYTEKHRAREIWKEVYKIQKESGYPYILYKDTINRSSMQGNIGIIKSSNLCAEIVEYSDANEYATCNLANLCLPQFVYDRSRPGEECEYPTSPYIDYKELAKTASALVHNLNNVIDRNWYPVKEAAISSFKHRPIGIGVQGLADVFMKFKVAFDSPEAAVLNKKIAEAIYYGAMAGSCEAAREEYFRLCVLVAEERREAIGNPTKPVVVDVYPAKVRALFPELNLVRRIEGEVMPEHGTYYSYLNYAAKAPLAETGQFHWERYGLSESDLSGLFDWESLRGKIKKFGVRNSLTTAYMPTASTSSIMGCTPCFEPCSSNVMTRKTLAGNVPVINKYLMKDLNEGGYWNFDIKTEIIKHNGSIQSLDLPQNLKDIYKTVWEIPQMKVVDMAAARQPFIDQSQSMNIHLEDFTFKKFYSLHMYGWKSKLKTGSYYIHSRPVVVRQKFTVAPEQSVRTTDQSDKKEFVDEPICLACE